MKLPKISIVTPSYNCVSYIEQTICSVLDQNYPNLEYIVIDGGSTDNTVDIIKKYEKHITYWISEKDNGQTHAINKGFEKCSGDIFNWLNSDDYLQPGALKTIGSAFDTQTNCVIGYINNFINNTSNSDWLERTDYFEHLPKMIGNSTNRQAGTFFRRDKIKVFFPLSENLHYTMDQALWIFYLLKYGNKEIKILDDILVNFRWHKNSKTGSDEKSFCMAYSKSFFKDLNSIFLRLAEKNNLSNHYQLIMENHPDKEVFALSSFFNDETVKSTVKEGLNYYLLNLLKDDYFRGNISQFNKKYRFLLTAQILFRDKLILSSLIPRSYIRPLGRFLKNRINITK